MIWGELKRFIGQQGRAALVSVTETRGSAPREAGARLVVRLDGGFSGSIGGGALEWQALAETQRQLAGEGVTGVTLRQSLGPDLGQCCGGSVRLSIETFDRRDLAWIEPLAEAEAAGPVATRGERDEAGRLIRHIAGPGEATTELFGEARTPLALFGAGHVGRALMLALAPLPFATRWIDPRADAFPKHLAGNVEAVHAADPVAQLEDLAGGTLVIAMTHSHALDLAVAARALPDPRFPFVGVIGSLTKRARFRGQLLKAGLPLDIVERLVCPVGVTGLDDKHPAVIAASVVVQLLQERAKQRGRLSSDMTTAARA